MQLFFFPVCFLQFKKPFYQKMIKLVQPPHSLAEFSFHSQCVVKKKVPLGSWESKSLVFGASRSWKLMCAEGSRLHLIFRYANRSIFHQLFAIILRILSLRLNPIKMFQLAPNELTCERRTWQNPTTKLKLDHVEGSHRFLPSMVLWISR